MLRVPRGALNGSWADRAACKGKPTSWWYAVPRTEAHADALAICVSCPVRRECGETAERRHELGRWGEYAAFPESRVQQRIERARERAS